jgi:hypothetical protein
VPQLLRDVSRGERDRTDLICMMPFHLGSSDLYDAVESIITTTTPANPRRAHTATLYVTVCIYQLPKPFLAILDGLEPAHIRLTSVFEHTSLYYYSYCQSIVRWKRLLLHYVPNATELIDVLAMLHRLLLQRILRSFGCMHSGTDRFHTHRHGISSLRDTVAEALRIGESGWSGAP